MFKKLFFTLAARTLPIIVRRLRVGAEAVFHRSFVVDTFLSLLVFATIRPSLRDCGGSPNYPTDLLKFAKLFEGPDSGKKRISPKEMVHKHEIHFPKVFRRQKLSNTPEFWSN